MRNLFSIYTLLLMTVIALSCDKADKDDIYPVIDMQGAEAFPKDCDTIYIGETFRVSALFTDNRELGAYSIDIHNNFDHHTHSSSLVECQLDPVKVPVNPFVFIDEYSIPSGMTTYSASDNISVPAGVDPGDYHFMIRLTDREGWQTLKGISIKLLPAGATR